jgi:hypothetical protein
LRRSEPGTCVFGCVHEQVQEAPVVVALGVVVGKFEFDLSDGFAEDVQAILELVEFLTGHDQFMLAETELAGPAAGLVVALAARTFAVLPGSSGAVGRREAATAPAAPPFA